MISTETCFHRALSQMSNWWVLLLISTQLLTNNLLQPYTSHRRARPVLWCQEKWFHGAWWLSWWSHWREPGRRPGPGSPAWAWVWGRSIWPSCRCPSCSHRCTGTNWRRAKTRLLRPKYVYSSREKSRFTVEGLYLLVKEGKEVAHDNEDWSWDSQEDLADVQCSLVQIFDS